MGGPVIIKKRPPGPAHKKKNKHESSRRSYLRRCLIGYYLFNYEFMIVLYLVLHSIVARKRCHSTGAKEHIT